ncbi:UNVERIFIED_CONTAM: hypothetical protein K2H54_002527 [Gekko kuhli]
MEKALQADPSVSLRKVEVLEALAEREAFPLPYCDPKEQPEYRAQNIHATICMEKVLQADPSLSLRKVEVLEALAEREAFPPSWDPKEQPEYRAQSMHATICMEKALQADPSVSLRKVEVIEALAKREVFPPSWDAKEQPEYRAQNIHATICMEKALQADPSVSLRKVEVLEALAEREAFPLPYCDPKEQPEYRAQNIHATICMEKALQADPSVSLRKVEVLEALAERELFPPSWDPKEQPEYRAKNIYATICMEKVLQVDPSVSLRKVEVLEALAEREVFPPSWDPKEQPEYRAKNIYATICMEKAPQADPSVSLRKVEVEVLEALAEREAFPPSWDPKEQPEYRAQNIHATICMEKALQADPSVSLRKVEVLEALAEREVFPPSWDPKEQPEYRAQNIHTTICMEKALQADPPVSLRKVEVLEALAEREAFPLPYCDPKEQPEYRAQNMHATICMEKALQADPPVSLRKVEVLEALAEREAFPLPYCDPKEQPEYRAQNMHATICMEKALQADPPCVSEEGGGA